MYRWHRVVCIFVVLVFCCFFISSQATAQLVDRIVAVVNGEIITLYELKQNLNNQYLISNKRLDVGVGSQDENLRKEVLNSMINDLLLVQEAERLRIEVSDTEVDNYIRNIKKEQNISEDEFDQFLQRQRLTLEKLRERVRNKIKKKRLLTSMVLQKVVVFQEEIESYYAKHQDKYQVSKKIHLRLIVHPDKEKLCDLRQQILAGKISFENAAKGYSQGPGAEQGGDLGFVDWKDLDSKWKNILKDLKKGNLSEVFSLQDRYAILYLQSSMPAGQKPLKEVREKIRNVIYQQKLKDRFEEYMEELRSKAVIEVRI